jgi:hypothetical protein
MWLICIILSIECARNSMLRECSCCRSWRAVAHKLLHLRKKTMQQHVVGVADVHLEKH